MQRTATVLNILFLATLLLALFPAMWLAFATPFWLVLLAMPSVVALMAGRATASRAMMGLALAVNGIAILTLAAVALAAPGIVSVFAGLFALLEALNVLASWKHLAKRHMG